MTALRDLLHQPAFALVHRAGLEVELFTGAMLHCGQVTDLPLPPLAAGAQREDVLAVVPYRQLAERGYACVDDGAPLLALRVDEQRRFTLAAALASLPDEPLHARDGHFDLDDAAYAEVVRRVLAEQIGQGAGSNFVIRRGFRARLAVGGVRAALTIFRRLLLHEQGSYWTFLVHGAGHTLVGATPERHASLHRGEVRMTPISGTYRYPASGPDLTGLLDFLADPKEIDELSMVVDEELKLLGRLCPDGARVSGPWLRHMARLAHTEYVIAGRTEAEVRQVLAATMFAPTVVGSPLRRAAEVVAEYERRGRGYYGGVLALIGQVAGQRSLDSAICLRTASLDAAGRLVVDVGATLVRGSDPATEAAETAAKAAGLLAAIADQPPRARSTTLVAPLSDHPRVRQALAQRRDRLAAFWRGGGGPSMALAHQRVLVVDAEDGFSAMLGTQLRALGASVEIRAHAEPVSPADADIVVLGPGPGDPLDRTDPRIAALHQLTTTLLAARVPLLAVCLSHQVLAAIMGLPVRRRPKPSQGTQREITFAGQRRRVGFYSTFSAYSETDATSCPVTGSRVTIHRDPASGEVYGLAAAGVRSVQFHIESVLTEDGPDLLAQLMVPLAHTAPAPV